MHPLRHALARTAASHSRATGRGHGRCRGRAGRRNGRGFTLIEMLVVLAVLALLLTLALPRYFSGLDRAKETVLVENLKTTREALDKYFGDQGRYPDSLDELVARRYLRQLPMDPIIGSSQRWMIVPPDPPIKGRVADLRSSAPGRTHDGRAFSAL